MSNSNETTEQCTGIYADIQNLQEIARNTLINLVRKWPDRMPTPGKLNLYVRADHSHLWNVWATSTFVSMDVTVKGVQHYSLAATKNAADMAIAVDAISDFNHGRVSHVAVVSDDSDFISLYAKLVEETEHMEPTPPKDQIPFLWVLTDRIGTKSNLLQDFFPPKYVHIADSSHPRPIRTPTYSVASSVAKPASQQEEALPLPAAEESSATAAEAENTAESLPEAPDVEADTEQSQYSSENNNLAQREISATERIAIQLIRDMPVGKFKSTDCQKTIRESFPGHQLASADGPAFGTAFRRDVFPFMEKRGVKETGNQRPRQYEMTMEAKRSLVRS